MAVPEGRNLCWWLTPAGAKLFACPQGRRSNIAHHRRSWPAVL